MDFKEQIKPFFWVDHEASASVCLDVGSYKNEIFEARASEGFEGNGYDWGSLAAVFLKEKLSELEGVVGFDPEASMFCAYSGKREALTKFILEFKAMCEDDDLIKDLFSHAELD